MPRRRLYVFHDIPNGVAEIVRTVVADYARRERAIKGASVTGAVLERYKELNRAVDDALADVEAGIRRIILDDISSRRGYDFSKASPFIAKNTYYHRKRKLIHDIAVNLELI